MADALHAVGLKRGDIVFSHSNVGFFGVASEGKGAKGSFDAVFGAFQDALGPEGTLVVPTFSYSFQRAEPYDPDQTPGVCGAFSEMLRGHPLALRSDDPAYSVAAIGARAREMLEDVPEDSFDSDSFFGRFLRANGVICNLNFDAGSTFVHYVEKALTVPYRYDKAFAGVFRRRGYEETRRSIIWVRDMTQPETNAVFEPFDRLARERGVARSAAIGRGAIVSIGARDTFELLQQALPKRPWLLTAAAKSRTIPDTKPVTGHGRIVIPKVPREIDAGGLEMLLTPLIRQGVGPGVDAAFAILAQVAPLTLMRFATGRRLGQFIVPERWEVKEARLANTSGENLFSLAEMPGLVAAHSRGFHGEIERPKLMAHIVTNTKEPDQTPAGELTFANDWGLCLPARELSRISSDRYRVDIEVVQCRGALSVGIIGDDIDQLVTVDLGGESAVDVARMVIAWRDRSNGGRLARGLGLFIHPRPFPARLVAPPNTRLIQPRDLAGNDNLAAGFERLVPP